MIFFPTSVGHVAELAPPGKTGEYMGVFRSAISLASVIGPWLGASLLDRVGASATWGTMFFFGMVATALFVFSSAALVAYRTSRAAGTLATPPLITMDTLSQRLRAETKDAHTAAERSGIMKGLLRGSITRVAYVDLLRNLERIYCALETGIDRNSNRPALAGIDLSMLRRHDSIRRDIDALSAGETIREPRPATNEYVARLHSIAASSPDLLLAHAYVRYMGDLSGGQILGGIVARALGLENGPGTAFYDFPSIPDADAFKHGFRDALDAASSVVDSDDVVREAQFGFALHQSLFQELVA